MTNLIPKKYPDFFYNKCKDAIDMNDYVNRIKKTISQSNIQITDDFNDLIIEFSNKEYNKLGNYEKPFYVIDKKRNLLYINDNDVWIKDNGGDLLFEKIKVLKDDILINQFNNFINSINKNKKNK